MNTVVLVISFLFVTVNRVSAQTIASKGIKAGFGWSRFVGDSRDYDAKLNYSLSAFFKVELHNRFSLQPELQFVKRGAEYHSTVTTPVNTIETNSETSVYYFDVIPALIFHATENIYLSFGPYFGLFVSGSSRSRSRIDGVLSKIESKIVAGQVNDPEVGLVLGTGFSIDHVSVEIRYQQGLSEAFVVGDSRNQIVQGLIGIDF